MKQNVNIPSDNKPRNTDTFAQISAVHQGNANSVHFSHFNCRMSNQCKIRKTTVLFKENYSNNREIFQTH